MHSLKEKNVKEAKSIAGEVKPDFAKAEQLINEALTNPETKDNAATWDVAGYIQKRINEKEMENAYLRKPYDTLKVYNSVLNMYNYYVKCDELAQIPNEKGKIKNKYRSANSKTILAERPNLINGGIQYFNLNKNEDAIKIFCSLCRCSYTAYDGERKLAGKRHHFATGSILCHFGCR